MGVDYRANFGLGIQVIPTETQQEEEEFDFGDFLEGKLLDQDVLPHKYVWFETGDGFYTGKTNKYYVIIKNPDLTNIALERKELKDFLNTKGISYIGKADIVGGLYIY